MITLKYNRLALLGASTLVISACSSGYTADTLPHVSQANHTAQSVGQPGELQKIADQLAAGGDHAAAIPLYRHLSSKAGNPLALDALANSLLLQGLTGESEKILRLLVSRGQATGQTWYNLGKTHLVYGRFEEGLRAFTNALVHNPTEPKYVSGKAIALATLGQYQSAIVSLHGQQDIRSLSNKTLILAAHGQSKEAVSLLEPVIRSGHGTSRDRQNLAMAYLLNGQESEAFQVSRVDLDAASTHETFTFYRSLNSLSSAERMQALVTGTIKPEWTRTEIANLELQENDARTVAAQRLTQAPVLVAEKPIPVVAEEKPVEDHANYVLTEIPPLVEPEGWALQIGAYRTIKNLMRGWTILYRQNGDLLQEIPPRRSEVNFGDRKQGPKGFYYRLNAGPLKTLARAKALCKELKARGTSCWIRPPEKTEGHLPKAGQAPQNVSAKKEERQI